VYTIAELNYAASKGYEVVRWLEIYHYDRTEFLFKNFMKTIMSYKLRYSPLPENIDLVTYCNTINERMSLTGSSIQMSPDLLKPNKQSRLHCKMIGNSVLGKFLQHSTLNQTKYATTQTQIEKLYWDENSSIEDFSFITPDVCQVITKPSKEAICRPNLNTNCILGAMVTAFARVEAHKHFDAIERAGGVNYYHDSDSFVFSLPKHIKSPLLRSQCPGDFKAEFGEDSTIKSYHALACKKLSFEYMTATGKIEYSCRASGFNLDSLCSKEKVDNNVYKEFLDKDAHGVRAEKKVPQSRKKKDVYYNSKKEFVTICNFKNTSSRKRVMITEEGTNLASLPFGSREKRTLNNVTSSYS
jgi:hypothetical protein